MKYRLSGLVNDSIVDGPGLRLAVFMQGCPYDCPGCHNPQTHDPLGGREADTEDVCAKLDKNPLLAGLTLSGGEPFLQPEAAAVMAAYARQKGLNVWAYTGSTYEALRQRNDPAVDHLLALVDVLVDGPFVLAQKSLDVPWRGSRNQRLIDVQQSLQAGETVFWQAPAW
ncbi:MAG: anaerobic ribonucleoside-triphosphate reductase activating protein [Clostridiales bacterium]|nr:anaerobic ribonucleoside-triphosphate reductase activating protein [Clostridiales bacterium]